MIVSKQQMTIPKLPKHLWTNIKVFLILKAPKNLWRVIKLKYAAKKLKSLLKTNLWDLEDTDYLDEIISAAAVSSLLIEIVSCIVKIADSVHELASVEKFQQ
ncbi:unnamed protein product [Fraxinus pennsylvanica]|uniref:Uncharacterized protein n=1 Tax=Fraxinus pennsylvanica TaxID=56036 RepID=A0AAD1ZUI9_9LAMI|nr:unnamed protein product [Fraxinus pennsylvanica]